MLIMHLQHKLEVQSPNECCSRCVNCFMATQTSNQAIKTRAFYCAFAATSFEILSFSSLCCVLRAKLIAIAPLLAHSLAPAPSAAWFLCGKGRRHRTDSRSGGTCQPRRHPVRACARQTALFSRSLLECRLSCIADSMGWRLACGLASQCCDGVRPWLLLPARHARVWHVILVSQGGDGFRLWLLQIA